MRCPLGRETGLKQLIETAQKMKLESGERRRFTRQVSLRVADGVITDGEKSPEESKV